MQAEAKSFDFVSINLLLPYGCDCAPCHEAILVSLRPGAFRLWILRWPPSHLQSTGIASTPHIRLRSPQLRLHCRVLVPQNGIRLPSHDYRGAPCCRQCRSPRFLSTKSMEIWKHSPVIWTNSENTAHALSLGRCCIFRQTPGLQLRKPCHNPTVTYRMAKGLITGWWLVWACTAQSSARLAGTIADKLLLVIVGCEIGVITRTWMQWTSLQEP